jgi:hypothetical protein
MNDQPEKRFIDEAIEVGYKKAPFIQKVPICPDFFIWEETKYIVTRLDSEWSDTARRGKHSIKMRPAHLIRAEKLNSLGVGRFFFRVEVEGGRVFELYYDRKPQKHDEGKGQWVLLSENFA